MNVEDLTKECPWCEGGYDREMLNIGSVQKCWDCKGTGLEGGLEAKAILDERERIEMEKIEKELEGLI